MRIRLTTMLLLTFLVYAFGHEWFWQTTGLPSALQNMILWACPGAILAIGFGMGAFSRNHTGFLKSYYILALLFTCAVIMSLVVDTPDKAVEVKPFYLMILAAMACVPIGVKIGYAFPIVNTNKLIHTAAVVLALLGYYSFFRTSQVATTGIVSFSWTMISWPMRIVELFALYYFIQKLVQSREHALQNSFLLLGPLLATCVLFTKNIILPTLAGLVFLTFANIYYAGARNALGNIAKIIAVLTILTIGFLGTDRLIDGALSTRISEEFWGHILKTNSLDSVILDDVVSGRTRIYEIVWPRFFQSPIFGNGYGQTIHYSELGVDSNENIPLHNAFLDQLISVGLFGLLLLLLPLLLWYIHCSTKAFYAASNKMSIAILTFVIALSVYSLGNSVKYFYGITCFAVCIMSLYYGQALQYAAQQNRDRNQPVRHTPISHS